MVTRTITVEAKTKGTIRSRRELAALAQTAGTVETRATGLGKATTQAGVGVRGLGSSARTASAGMQGMSVQGLLATSAVVGLGVAVVRTARQASSLGFAFERGLAEVNTLLGGTSTDLERVSESVLELTRTFGGTAVAQIQAYYAAYSAGAGTFERATAIVVQSSKLAIGGLATLESSVGLLTGTINAYSQQGLTATRASDLLFVAVRNGVTTISQLGASLANVTATAANFGVAFEIVTSAIAGLTASGTVTAQATTQINALIISLQRFTPQAVEFARTVGITSTAPEDFAQVITQLNSALARAGSQTERNTILFRLFGNQVEALRAAASLSGGGFETFTRTIRDSEDAAGATDTAFQKLNGTLAQQREQALGNYNTSLTALGMQLNMFIVPALTLASGAVSLLSMNLPLLGGAIATLTAGVLVLYLRRWTQIAIAKTIATGGTNLLTAGIVGLGAVLVGVGTQSFLRYGAAADNTTFSLDDVRGAQENLTRAVIAGDKAAVESSIARVEAIRAVEAENIKTLESTLTAQQNAVAFYTSGVTGAITSFLGGDAADEANRQLAETQRLLAQARTRVTSLDSSLNGLSLDPNFLQELGAVARTLDRITTSGTSLAVTFSEAGINETEAQRIQRQLDNYNQSVALAIGRARGEIEQNSLDGGFIISQEAVDENLKRIETLTETSVKVNMEGKAAIARANKTANEREAREQKSASDRLLQEQMRLQMEQLETSKEYARASEQILVGGINSVGSQIGDSLLDQTDTWRDFGNGLIDIAKQTASGIIAQFTSQLFLRALGLASQGVGGGGGGRGNGVNLTGGLFNTGAGAAGTAIGGGGLGAIGAGGGTLFTSAGAGVAGTGASVFAAIAAPLAIIAGGALILNSLLSERTLSERTDLRVGADGGVSGQTTTETRRGAISAAFNGRIRTDVEQLDREVTSVFEPIFSKIGSAISEQAGIIGGAVSNFDADLRNVDLNNIEAIGRTYADTLALSIDGFNEFAVAGKSASEVLGIVISDFNNFNSALKATGGSTVDFTPALASLNTQIITAIDGIQGERDADGNIIRGSGAQAGLQGIFGFRSDAAQREVIGAQIQATLGFRPTSTQQFANRYDSTLAEANNPNRSESSRAGFLIGAQQFLSTDIQALVREYLRLAPNEDTDTSGSQSVQRSRQQRIDDAEFRTRAEADLARSLNNDPAQIRHRETLQAFGRLITAVTTGSKTQTDALNEGNILLALANPPPTPAF